MSSNTKNITDMIETLVTENIDLPIHLVGHFTTLDRDDAASEAGWALFMAAKYFLEEGVQGNFRQYAYRSIRNALLSLLKKNIARNCRSLERTCGSDQGGELSFINYVLPSNDEYTSVDDQDMLRDFFFHHCTETERHIISIKLALYAYGRKLTQAQVAQLIEKTYHEKRQQAGLCKRLKKMKRRFFAFVNACERGDNWNG